MLDAWMRLQQPCCVAGPEFLSKHVRYTGCANPARYRMLVPCLPSLNSMIQPTSPVVFASLAAAELASLCDAVAIKVGSAQ
jgi:hypothetical protein